MTTSSLILGPNARSHASDNRAVWPTERRAGPVNGSRSLSAGSSNEQARACGLDVSRLEHRSISLAREVQRPGTGAHSREIHVGFVEAAFSALP